MVNKNVLVESIVVRIKDYGIGIQSPKRLNGYVFCGHSCGDFYIPAIEGVANLSGICGNSYVCTEIQNDGSDFATAVGIEGNGVLIDCPSSLNG